MGIGNRESGIGKSGLRAGRMFAVSFVLPALSIPYSRFSIPGAETAP